MKMAAVGQYRWWWVKKVGMVKMGGHETKQSKPKNLPGPITIKWLIGNHGCTKGGGVKLIWMVILVVVNQKKMTAETYL